MAFFYGRSLSFQAKLYIPSKPAKSRLEKAFEVELNQDFHHFIVPAQNLRLKDNGCLAAVSALSADRSDHQRH